ncbi:RNA-directed DNA polymerase, eukaryota, Reverse transcriptase zinc-binding domain protein [Artemisia annua]|uniref:RNA-directed DNA polymerase, eukaryota, Reverse transcriptase zinc-binding domain protein n=1 Tax=Artemisia annua TaxID=35608 RepID=A0A2U1PMQ0_ARTAN|nr:RNA-directed DNA polymerase, eukaryota, Reverse transcriptase zinc-binding domain protein [Artemisia annua]
MLMFRLFMRHAGKLCHMWKWTSNGILYDKGSHVILGWNDDIVDVMVIAQTNQVMHVHVNMKAENKALFYSLVYVDKYYIDHRALWMNLNMHSLLMKGNPWVLLGDFNVSLNLEDHCCGRYEPYIAMREFKDCVAYIKGYPYHISDHSPCVLLIPTVSKPKPKPFKFFNFLVQKEGFKNVFDRVGINMFMVFYVSCG